jgi:hypothetical protein
LEREKGGTTYAIERRVGRLIEVRIVVMRVVDDVLRLDGMLHEALAELQTAVMCVDLRGIDSLPPDTADRLMSFVAHPVPRCERVGVLLRRDSSPFDREVARAIERFGEARPFRQPAELQAWLSGALGAAERARLEEFLVAPFLRPISVQMRAVHPPK